MFDREFFKMGAEFMIIIGIGMLLVYVFSNYAEEKNQIAVPAEVSVQ